jgi:transcriptional regulator with XRE-family HTH domain
LNKAYRDGYLQSHVRGGIAYQIRALRTKIGLSQVEFAEATGKKQSTISRLENTEYGKVSVQTLLDIACATDVALLVRFVDYSLFLRTTADMSPQALGPDNIFETNAHAIVRGKTSILNRAFAGWGSLHENPQSGTRSAGPATTEPSAALLNQTMEDQNKPAAGVTLWN